MAQRQSVLHEATLRGEYISVKALSESFPEEGPALFLAYEESRSLVEFMIRQFGVDGILALLRQLQDGKNIEEAMPKALSITFDELEREWHSHLKREMTWFTYLIHHLYDVLFFLAALITIYAFVIALKRKRAQEDDEDYLI